MASAGWSQSGLPFQGATPASRHASWTGAESAAFTRKAKTARYIAVVKAAGADGITDHLAAERTGLPLQSINSIRNGLGPLVVDADNPERIERPDTRATVRTRWKWDETGGRSYAGR